MGINFNRKQTGFGKGIGMRLIRLTALMLSLVLLITVNALASSTTPQRVDKEEIRLDGNWQDYDLAVNTYAYCPLYLSGNGLLQLKVQTFYDSLHYVYLLDSNLETVDYTSIYGKGSASPETVDFVYFLTAGTYYVRVESWNDASGLFRIKGDFTAAVTNEIEPNNTFEQAMDLAPNAGSVRGFLSTDGTAAFWSEPLPEGSQDFKDYYVLNVNPGHYTIRFSPQEAMETSFYVNLYDSSRSSISEQYLSKTTDIEADLEAGTYYLLVESANRASGQYEVSVLTEGEVPPAEVETEDWYGGQEEQNPQEESPFILDQIDQWTSEVLPVMEKFDWDSTPIRLYIQDSGDRIYGLFHSREENSFTWMEAVEFCEMMHGHLATINSREDQEFLAPIIQEAGVNAWIGGYTTNHQWKWITKEPMDETFWYEGEPNGSGDFMQIYFTGDWDDTFNENPTVTDFLCEWEAGAN